MKTKTPFLFLLPILFLSGCSNTTNIDAQEKCSKGAKAFYDNYDDTLVPKINYSNHYNQKLNKCLILITGTNVYDGGWIDTDGLYSIFENKHLGQRTSVATTGDVKSMMGEKPAECFVSSSKCSNNEEWERLIKPYMEE